MQSVLHTAECFIHHERPTSSWERGQNMETVGNSHQFRPEEFVVCEFILKGQLEGQVGVWTKTWRNVKNSKHMLLVLPLNKRFLGFFWQHCTVSPKCIWTPKLYLKMYECQCIVFNQQQEWCFKISARLKWKVTTKLYLQYIFFAGGRGEGRLGSVHSAIRCSNFHMSAVFFAFKIDQGRGEERRERGPSNSFGGARTQMHPLGVGPGY